MTVRLKDAYHLFAFLLYHKQRLHAIYNFKICCAVDREAFFLYNTDKAAMPSVREHRKKLGWIRDRVNSRNGALTGRLAL